MATLLLRAAGTFVGGLIGGPFGAILGASGALAGYAIDQSLFGSNKAIEGARLESTPALASYEGSPIPRAYGAVRLGGQLIWSTRFREEQKTENVGGGKGFSSGASVTNYSYFGNIALGLCEGKIAGIRRIWADGAEIDLTKYDFRLYLGDENQAPDSFIESLQGEGKTPAYKGLAYVVFENLPLAEFGNRIPQLTFEVLKPVGLLERELRAVTIIPGASEYVYEPGLVSEKISDGEEHYLNRHVLHAGSDWEASINELQALCPNLEHVALVVSWFGTDLRCGHCKVEPRVEVTARQNVSQIWSVSGISRSQANLVSQIESTSAFGGTPSDESVFNAIKDLKKRGIKVTLYPFMMMDIAPGNGLPDPYGRNEQAAFPWRGRITSDIAPLQENSDDRTASIRMKIDLFLGSVDVHDFQISLNDGKPSVQANTSQWSYRRLILHYAHLAKLAGGVDAFVIGSEMRGLTTLRDEADAFPFVDGLVQLASDVKMVLGPTSNITYAADWSEYFGYQPADGSGDVFFHLDPLWASAAIDAIGIDNYMPLADWRDNVEFAQRDEFYSGYDGKALARNIESGEGYDWYYASDIDRTNGTRSPISSGDNGDSWLYRFKDLKGWWSHQHYDRRAGVAVANASEWVPQSKPIWFTELGAPATDKAANQPNVFPDPKSSENNHPYYSTAGRDDLAQRRFLEAHLSYWAEPGGTNPISSLYGAPMVDMDRIYMWSWDARPFPAFPMRNDIWSDGANWQKGHWLTGRLGGAPANSLIEAILKDYGIASSQTHQADGICDGLLIPHNISPRTILERLAQIWGLSVQQNDGTINFVTPSLMANPAFVEKNHIVDESRTLMRIERLDRNEIPNEFAFSFKDTFSNYSAASVSGYRVGESGHQRASTLSLSISLSEAHAKAYAETMLQAQWASRTTLSFQLPPEFEWLQPGDLLSFEADELSGNWTIIEISQGDTLKIEARSIDRLFKTQQPQQTQLPRDKPLALNSSTAAFEILDLPAILNFNDESSFAVVTVSQWSGEYALYASLSDNNYRLITSLPFNGVTGQLEADLSPGFSGRWDHGDSIIVRLGRGSLSSVDEIELFAGANALAVLSNNSARWEIVQFLNAELVGPKTYKLTKLLRGQAGSEAEMRAGANKGSPIVVLDRSLQQLQLNESELGVPLNWKVVRSGELLSSPSAIKQQAAVGLRALEPLRPVHLSAKVENGLIVFSWIRQTRIGGDNWRQVEVPLSEEFEMYKITISDISNDHVLMVADIFEPVFSTQASQFDVSEIKWSVAQISAKVGPGASNSSQLKL